MCSGEPRGCGRCRLNFDVLHLICNTLTEVSDVLSFSLTCSTLRKGALQRCLRMSPVALPHPDSVERFHNFIFADPASRAPHLYGLVLSPKTDYAPHGDPRFINYLVAVLETATRLEYLHFSTTMGQPVCTAVAELTRLRELVVVSDARSHGQHNPEALKNVLAGLRCPLRDLTVADYEMGQISASLLHNNLLHFAPTLRSLTLEQFHFDISPSSVTTPFTAMRSLRIDSFDRYHFYRLDVLLRLFPNLNDTLFLGRFTPPADQHPALRDQSKEAQRDYTWSGLDRLVCSADMAYLMALRCPIRCMDIDWPVLCESRYIAEALRDNCPRQLLLPVILFSHDRLQNLHGLFPPQAADKLTHLVLFVAINFNCRRPAGECNCFSWDRFMLFQDIIAGALKHLRLTHLRIVFHYYVYEPVLGSGCDEGYSRNVAHDTDLHPAAIRLVNRMETLQHVFLTTCGVRQYGEPWAYWHSSKAWRVVPGDEDPAPRRSGTPRKRRSCVELSDEAARAVIDEEGLHLRDTEEQMVRQCLEPAST